MAGLSADRPTEVVLAARVARQFYLEGVSKIDIADRLGISRFRVARLLECAREAGMVRIEIGLPGGNLDAGLSAELCSAFGLRHAFVFDFPDNEEPALRHRLGEAAGQALMDLMAPGDVLGISWSRTLSGLDGRADPDPAVPDRPAHRGGATAGRPGPARRGPQRGPGGRRPGPRLLRADARGRRADGRGHPPPRRHRRRLRARAFGDDSRGGHRRLGGRAVHDL